jgi:AcrR family transcriptional regulator
MTRRSGLVAPWLPSRLGEDERASVTPEAVLEAAHRLVHEGGPEALTMRSLAAELGVGTTAVYGQIGSKERLLVAVADFVLSEVRTDPSFRRRQDGEDGFRRLRALALEVRNVLVQHPDIHGILASELVVTPASIAIADACVSALAEIGFEGTKLTHAYNSWVAYVVGGTVLEIKPAYQRDEGIRTSIEAYLRDLDASTYPNVAARMRSLRGRAYWLRWESGPIGPAGKSFEWGLDALLEAIRLLADKK